MTARRLMAALLVAMTLGAPSAMASDVVVDVDRTDASGPCVWVGRDGQRIGYCIR